MNKETDELTPKEVKVMIAEAARQHMPVPAEWRAILQGNCTVCGKPLTVCPSCEGRKGGLKTARTVTPEQKREWGKLGGRRRKDGRRPQTRIIPSEIEVSQ